MPQISRRGLLLGGAGVAGVAAAGGVTAWSQLSSSPAAARGLLGPESAAVARAEAARRSAGQRVVTAALTPKATSIDLGGRMVRTWSYGDTVPGPLLRVDAGDRLRVLVDNQLPAETTIHWHGLALRNDMDGVPGVTQPAVAAGRRFGYDFTAPDPGTYFYHPHVGVQLDRGLYGVLVVDDPNEPGRYDEEWIVVLDDWLDGTGRTPDQVLRTLQGGSMDGMENPSQQGMDGMNGMQMQGMGGRQMQGMGGRQGQGMGGMQGRGMQGMETMRSPLLGGAGDVTYAAYLVNGRTADAPTSLRGKPGQRVRIRIVNAGSDTAFRVALGGHRLTVTHSDGFPVSPATTDALVIGMGERYDVEVTLGDGVFPLTALAEGKQGAGFAVVRTAGGRAPSAATRPAELSGKVVVGGDLSPAEQVRLSPGRPDITHTLSLAGSMKGYRWTINGQVFADSDPLLIAPGDRVRLRFENRTMMFHPMHVHGHTFAVRPSGMRKDTVIVRPRRRLEVDLVADNPGLWVTHCHNIYHAEAGMMRTLAYRA